MTDDRVAVLTAKIDDVFARWNRNDEPGLAVGVARKGSVIYRRGFGMASLETRVANGPSTRMRIASVTKHFTGLLSLLLAEEGRFDLDAPIRCFIPELTGASGEPTARQLMRHQGGSRCNLDLGLICRGYATPPVGASLAVQVRQKGCNFVPGETMIYNNGGYDLVSIAIERVGGASFANQLKQRFFDPLGMFETVVLASDLEITPGIATMHVPLEGGGGWRRGLYPSEELKGDGAIVSTVDDMLRWARHLRKRDVFGSPETWAALTEPPTFSDGTLGHYGLGLVLLPYRGVEALRHSGGVVGGSSEMLTFPGHGLDIVILANGARGANPAMLAEKVADIVLEDDLGPQTRPVDASDHEHLLGDWWSSETGMIYSIMADDGALKLSHCAMPSRFAIPLEWSGADTLVAVANGMAPVRIHVGPANSSGLRIQFGIHASHYKKLPDVDDISNLAQQAVGKYYSHDGDCVASITINDDGATINFREAHGSIDRRLNWRGDSVAVVSPLGKFDYIWAAVTFERVRDSIKGFRVSTPRTRNLGFQRC